MHPRDACSTECPGAHLHDGISLFAKSLRSVVDNPARMRRASIGSWARKRARRRVLGSALRDSMWRRRLEGFLSPRPDKDRSSMSLEVSFTKGIDESSLQCIIFSINGWGQDDSLNFSCCDVV